jgi:Bacterial sugar transferase
MKALLICPAEREAVRSLSEAAPLANLVSFGKPLVAYWLDHLVKQGAKEVRILATDRPDQVRALVGDGARWGLDIEVTPELRELTPAEATAKYRKQGEAGWLPEGADVTVMDHFPGLANYPLFKSHDSYFAALKAWMPLVAPNNQVSVKEVEPGIWVGLRSRIAPSAQLKAPCWIGSNVIVESRSVVGPMAILEDRVMVESHVEVTNSQVAPETFLGELVEVKNSLANGHILINWQTGSCTRVPDKFLMCSLGEHHHQVKTSNWIGRLAALAAMIITAPVALIPLLKAKLQNQPSLRSFIAVRPQLTNNPNTGETLVYYELAHGNGWLKCWPQLWNIVKGDFAWVGNRPLSPSEVSELTNDFERLWLAAPIGLISLAHAEGRADSFTDETRACASFYAVQANWRLDISILARTFLAATKRSLATLF